MFEDAELGHSIDKATYRREVPPLRDALLEAQFELAQRKDFAVVLLINGVDGAGRGEAVNTLTAWMDSRYIETNAMGDPSDEERERPPMWRFWRALPPHGRIGIFFGNWYTAPIIDCVMSRKKHRMAALDRSIEEIRRFERMLAEEGTLLLKFWYHLSKPAQRKRLKSLERDPRLRWRVTRQDWQRFKLYDEFRAVSERALRHTSEAHAPWIVVEGVDERYRNLVTGKTVLEGLQARLQTPAGARAVTPVPAAPPVDAKDVINTLDLTRKLTDARYGGERERWQGTLNLLTRHKRFADHSVVAVFEGNDAAGKGGAIRRVAEAVDARQLRIVPIAAPSDEEKARPYLWRFWRHLPRQGHLTLFDRSWYGRVLVERVEGFCSEYDWRRAYSEINDFEEEMTRHGIVVVKFWLAISKDEQLRRFKSREHTSFKHFKITDEDWRNRKKWDQYVAAVCDMVDRTSTGLAPWTIVPANDKNFARIKVLKTLCTAMERELD